MLYENSFRSFSLLQYCSDVLKELNALEISTCPLDFKESCTQEEERSIFIDQLRFQVAQARLDSPIIEAECSSRSIRKYFQRHVEVLDRQLERVLVYQQGNINRYMQLVERHSLENKLNLF